jgi:hypothetical protein
MALTWSAFAGPLFNRQDEQDAYRIYKMSLTNPVLGRYFKFSVREGLE